MYICCQSPSMYPGSIVKAPPLICCYLHLSVVRAPSYICCQSPSTYLLLESLGVFAVISPPGICCYSPLIYLFKLLHIFCPLLVSVVIHLLVSNVRAPSCISCQSPFMYLLLESLHLSVIVVPQCICCFIPSMYLLLQPLHVSVVIAP